MSAYDLPTIAELLAAALFTRGETADTCAALQYWMDYYDPTRSDVSEPGTTRGVW